MGLVRRRRIAVYLMRVRLHSSVVLSLLSAVHTVAAQAGPSPEPVHRLRPSAFPRLPIAIRDDLERRHCLVPQPYDARSPANVAHGAFTAPNISEWAILCSVQDTSEILIYRMPSSEDARVVDSLERAADLGWVQDIGDNRRGFSRLIRALPRVRVPTWRRDDHGRVVPQPFDHDAIEQSFIGKASEAFYHAAGRWYRRATTD